METIGSAFNSALSGFVTILWHLVPTNTFHEMYGTRTFV